MNLLALDIGSSSVKAAVLRDGAVQGGVIRAGYETDYDGPRAEVPASRVLDAVAAAVRELGEPAKHVDLIALAVQSPAWVAMDSGGEALTPIITHQDRRSVEQAKALEAAVGRERHLQLAGNRPFPGGISSTTWKWFHEHHPDVVARCDLVGHLNTFLHRQITGSRVIDPSNASFTGLYSTADQSGWVDELCAAAGVPRAALPDVLQADRVGGKVTREAAGRFGLTQGTQVLVGMVDTSAAMLLAGAEPGTLLNLCGSTDVLALCTDSPTPHPKILTRALGIGRRWMSISTLAAAGSAIDWVKEQLFPDWPLEKFHDAVREIAREGARQGRGGGGPTPNPAGGVAFEPYLAGERTSIEQRRAAFTGLTRASTRQHMLAAVIEALVKASARRVGLLKKVGLSATGRREVIVSGGLQGGLEEVLHRDWPRRWTFTVESEATLRGLGKLEPRE